MTNGDMMIAIYGIVDAEVNERSVRLFPKDGGQLWVTKDWWNAEYRDCDHCAKTYGTLGCCDTVSNEWVYSCKEGHEEYARGMRKFGSTTKNDLALIHTEGLDEEIRCTMCTNSMKSDRGCDGSCVVDKDMYKAVTDAIERRIQPTTKNNLGVDCVARQDVERFIEGFINEYTPEEELEFINLELDGLKHLPPATPQEPRWIPVDDPYTELPKKDLWVTRNDNGNLCVDKIYYDMTEWNDYIGDVVAYMEYKEPVPYKEVIEE